MNNNQKRILLFLLGCVPTRIVIAYLAKNINDNYLPILGYIALIPAIGFAYLFWSGKRKTGPETFGAPIWWNNLRPIHSLLYFLFAFNAINKIKKSWVYLMYDVILGLSAFIIYHFGLGKW